MGPDESPAWRVFVSYTSELADFPPGGSYVGAVKAAVSGAGHVAVDVADFAPLDTAPARLVVEKVKSCEVYVAVLGMRYGSVVRDRPEVSYPELEFDTATEAGLDVLVFLLEAGAAPGIPPDALVDRESRTRAESFRQRLLTTTRRSVPPRRRRPVDTQRVLIQADRLAGVPEAEVAVPEVTQVVGLALALAHRAGDLVVAGGHRLVTDGSRRRP